MDVSINIISFCLDIFISICYWHVWNTMILFLFIHMNVCLAHYIIITLYKYKNVLLDTCFCYLRLIPEKVWQHLDICHNNATLIFSSANNVQHTKREKLFPWSCMLLFNGYDNHDASHNSYRFQKYDLFLN